MEFRAFFKHMETSDALLDYAERKLRDSAETYVHKPVQLTVTFAVEGAEYHISCHLFGDGLSMHVESRVDTNMYSCVDLLQDKLEERLRRRKDRLTDHKKERLELGSIAEARNEEEGDWEMEAAVI